MEIKINRDGAEFGPYTLEQVNELLADGSLLPTDLAWHDPMETWAELSHVAATINQAAETAVEEEDSAVGETRGGGRYRIMKLLGRGGMGVVYLAMDEQLNEEIALKSFPPEMAVDEGAIDDMKREVQKSRKLSHPNIIRIHDLVNLPGEDPFLTMEYVEGQELADMRRDQPNGVFAWEDIKQYIIQLCDALTTAHNENTAHRDLKPTQMMIDQQGRLKLCDFGIAASMADSLSFSSMKYAVSGTLLFMSPQQMNGEVPRAADDIYALGATLYDLMTGKPPFYTGNVNVQVMTRPPTSMKDRLKEFGIENDIPDYVDQLVLACLAKEPENRPASAEEIKNWILSEGGAATLKTIRLAFKPPGFKKELVFDLNRKVFQITCSVVGLLVLGVLGWLVFKPPKQYDLPALSKKLTADEITSKNLPLYLHLDNPPSTSVATMKGEAGFQNTTSGNQGPNVQYEDRLSDRGIRLTSTNYIQISNREGVGNLQDKDYTLAAHFYAYSAPKKDKPDERQFAILMKQGHHLGLSYGFDRRFAMSHHYISGTTNLVAAISPKKYAINKWHHVVGTVNKAEGKVVLYVDGEEVASADFLINALAYNSKMPWRIGVAHPEGRTHQWYADGSVDQARMYSRMLEPKEVLELYKVEQSNPLEKGMLVHYPFNGGDLVNVRERLPGVSSGGLNLNRPKPEQMPKQADDRFGEPNQAYFFDTNNGKTNSFSSGGGGTRGGVISRQIPTKSRAVSVWFKPEKIGESRQAIVSMGAGDQGWELLVDEKEGLIGNWGQMPKYLSGGNVKSGKWHHAVFGYDENRKLISLYLDGDLLGIYTNSASIYGGALNIGGPPLAPKSQRKRMVDDKELIDEVANSYFHGAIDDVRFYLQNLDDEAVGELYAAEKPTSWFWTFLLLFVLAFSGTLWVLYRKGYRIPAKYLDPILKRLPQKFSAYLVRFKQMEQEPEMVEAAAPA